MQENMKKEKLIEELTDEPDILSEVFLQQKDDFKESEDTILRNIIHSEEYKNLVEDNKLENEISTFFKNPLKTLKKLTVAIILTLVCLVGAVVWWLKKPIIKQVIASAPIVFSGENKLHRGEC